MDDILSQLKLAQNLASNTKRALTLSEKDFKTKTFSSNTYVEYIELDGNQIYQALLKLSESLAKSYAQVKVDIQDTNRQSWAGTAHEIREVLRGILEIMAPDNDIVAQPGWQQEKGTTGPTQKQKVVHILKKYSAGSKEEEVVKQVNTIEDRVGSLVRAIYSRASNAAHTGRDRREVIRILNYFEAFAHDLLNLE